MSAKNKAVGEGSPEGLSEAVEDGQNAALAQIMMHIMRTAISPENVLTPEAQVQIALRNKGARGETLERLIMEIVPERVDVDLWLRWINGGLSPFPKLERVGKGDERPAQTLARTPHRVVTQQKKIDRLKAELEQEEQKLDYYEAHRKAAVQWCVVDQLVNIMTPAISMGPAWTVMRALSGYISYEDAEKKTFMLDEDQKEEGIREIRAIRQRETDQMCDDLDFWSGHCEFENSIRDAIRNVIRDYEILRPVWVKSGRRRRTRSEIKSSVNPEASVDMKEVLAGFPSEPSSIS